jgi:osmotically-inducible protein OsmY
MTVRSLFVLVSVAALGLSGCSTVQDKTTGQAFDEAAAGTGIKTKLFAVGGFERFGEVDVEVSDQLVLLAGRVPSEQDKADAERIAWSAGNVTQVANELVVAPRDLERDARDRLITERVRAHLIANRGVKGVNYNVQVFDGNVYLLGVARSPEELKTAAEATARIGGVKRVVSYVKVTGQPAQAEVFTAPAAATDASLQPQPTEQPDRFQPIPLGPGRDSADPSIEGSSLPPAQAGQP